MRCDACACTPAAPTYHRQAVTKLQAAIRIDERLHEAHWGLGNAYTSQARGVRMVLAYNTLSAQGLLQSDQRKAEDYFRLAKSVFAKALELVCTRCVHERINTLTAASQDPGNRAYARAMDMIEKAPEIYQELQQQLQLQQASGRGGSEVRADVPGSTSESTRVFPGGTVEQPG